ncbi:MAG: hypothetical protein RIF46_03475 [Cyclobacteriaceae bacterium]
MKNEDKIVELLADMVHGQDAISKRLAKLEKQMAKNNAQIAENSRAVISLADRIEMVVDHEKRLGKLERVVFK